MTQVQPGDTVFHLLKAEKGAGYFFVGHAIAASGVQILRDEPPIPTDWAGMSPYYRVPLTSFTKLTNPVSVQKMFDEHRSVLNADLVAVGKGRFYEKKSDGRLQVSLRYIAKADGAVAEMFLGIMASQGQSPGKMELDSFVLTIESPAYPDYTPPGMVKTEVTRRIRDTKPSREAKRKFGFKCAICGLVIGLPRGGSYAEAHHLKPLVAGHDGPDTPDNILVLCPNHHAEFDYGIVAIEPDTHQILHRDTGNPWHGKELAYRVDYLSREFVSYHLSQIFLSQK